MRVTQLIGANVNFQRIVVPAENGEGPTEAWRLQIQERPSGDLIVVDMSVEVKQSLLQQMTGITIAAPGEVPKPKPRARSRAKKGS